MNKYGAFESWPLCMQKMSVKKYHVSAAVAFRRDKETKEGIE